MLKFCDPRTIDVGWLEYFQNSFFMAGESVIPGGNGLSKRMIEKWLEYIDQPPLGRSPSYTFMTSDVEQGTIVGVVNIRTALMCQNTVNYTGHVSYSIAPYARGRGYGKEQLALALGFLRMFAVPAAMITCLSDNPYSRGVILANGGVLEDSIYPGGQPILLERYLIPLG